MTRARENFYPVKTKGFKMHAYANAQKVLPEELLREIRKHYEGGMLYVPKNGSHEERRRLIIVLWEQKMGKKEISLLSGLSARRVYQIIKEHKTKRGEMI